MNQSAEQHKRKLVRGSRRKRSSLKRKADGELFAQRMAQAPDQAQIHPNIPPSPVELNQHATAIKEHVAHEEESAELNIFEYDFDTLINQLPLRHFKLEMLDQEEVTYTSLESKNLASILKRIDFNDSIHTLLTLSKDVYHVKRLLKENPELDTINFKKEAFFLKKLHKSMNTLLTLVDEEKMAILEPNDFKTIATLKRQLNEYYDHYQPVVDFVCDIELKHETSFWAKVWHKITFWKDEDKDLIKFNKAKADLKEANQKLQHSFYYLHELLYLTNRIIYGKEIYQHIIGEISKCVYKSDQIKFIATTLIDTVPLQGLSTSFELFYPTATDEGKLNLLDLIKQMLALDTEYHLIDCDGESAIFDRLIMNLRGWCTSASEEKAIDKLVDLIETRKSEAKKHHKKYLMHLSNDYYTASDLSKQFRLLKKDYENHIVTQRHCIIMAFDTLENLPDSILSSADHKPFVDSIQWFADSISIVDHLNLRQMFEETLNATIHRKIYDLPEWAQNKFDGNVKLHPMNNNELTFNKKLELVAQGKISPKAKMDLQKHFCLMLRESSKASFKKINLSQLKKATWENEFKNFTLTSSLDEAFPNLNNLLMFERAVRQFIPDVILFEYHEEKRPRTNLSQIANLLDFFVGAEHYAHKNSLIHVLASIQKGLSHPALKDIKPYQDSKILHALHLPIENIANNRMPDFMKVVDRLEQLHETCKGSFMYLILGSVFNKFANMQTTLSKEKQKEPFISNFILKRLAIESNNSDPTLTISDVSNIKQDTLYIETAQAMVINQVNVANLDFSKMAKRCDKAHKLDVALVVVNEPLTPTEPSCKPIIQILNHCLTKSNKLPTLRLMLTTLGNLAANRHLQDKDILVDETNKMIMLWTKTQINHHKHNAFNEDQIEAMTDDINQGKDLLPKSLIELDGSGMIESTLTHAIADLRDVFDINDMPSYSQAYIKTLSSYLEGTQQDQITLPSQHEADSYTNKESQILLQDIEEETNPEEIGFAETWNIFKQISNNIIEGPPFSYENLRDTFIKAFPWAIENPNKIGTQAILPNLLHVDPNVALDIQKTVMELVFISLDTIGKLAGPYGEYVLYNLEKIDHIITGLTTVTQALDSTQTLLNNEQAQAFLDLLDGKIMAIKENNELLFDKLTNAIPVRPDEHFAANPQVNQLMSMNEQEVHHHIREQVPGFNDPSILPPQVEQENHGHYTSEVSSAPQQTTIQQEENVDEWQALADEVASFFDDDLFSEYDEDN